MDYLSFDLRLGEWNPLSKTGVAEVLYSPAGEGGRCPFLLEIDITACAQRAFRTSATAAELGRQLAEAALCRESLTLWHESYQIARERGRGLRLRLHIDSWELSRLPWELLYDARRGDFLVFDPMVSLVRYLRLHAVPPSPRQSPTLRIMALVASPRDQLQLDSARELAVLKSSLQELVTGGQAEIIICEHITHEKLQVVLMEHRPDVVHFIGHGQYNHDQHMGLLLLEDEEGRSAPLEAPEAARLLRRYGVSLVVLNACETASGAWAGLAPALVRAEIPAVVAMQWPVEDRAAIRFSRTFYKALSMGQTIDECVAEGRVGASVGSLDPNDWAAPVLFLRSLSGRLWKDQLSRPRGAKLEGVAERGPLAEPAMRALEAVPAEESIYFKTRGPLLSATDAELLVDRPELRRAIRLAQQPSVTQYIAFLSARQTGKTTLLFRLMELLSDSCACTLIDLSVLRAQDARACFRYVAFQLLNDFRPLLDESSLPAERVDIQGPTEFLEFLRELATALPTPRIIVLLDEVGALSPEASDSFFNTLRTVFTQGRGLHNALSKYLFVFSGAVDLFALTFGANSPLNICEKLYLRDLEPPDVAKIVGQFVKLDVAVPPEAPQRIYQLTGGHPYLTMRLCALLERAKVKELSAEHIERAAEQMLEEDDNIRHVIQELERRPAERRRLYSILLEGRKIPFSRNDPVLASLEMIGAIRPVQPCEVRNALYERALRQYFAQAAPERAQPAVTPPEDLEATYTRLWALRAEALSPDGHYDCGRSWESFAAALFSLVPAFSVVPNVRAEAEEPAVILAVNPEAQGGSYWSIYQPAILVTCMPPGPLTAEDLAAKALKRASAHNVKLVLVMGSGMASLEPEERARYSGSQGDVCVVLLDDSEIVQLLEQRSDLDAHLRNRVLEARLHKL